MRLKDCEDLWPQITGGVPGGSITMQVAWEQGQGYTQLLWTYRDHDTEITGDSLDSLISQLINQIDLAAQADNALEGFAPPNICTCKEPCHGSARELN